jgi:phosphoglucosamine mutase
MSRQFFGTDGIRGTVGQAPITPDFVLRLAHAVGQVLRRNAQATSHSTGHSNQARPQVLIGKDTRISGYMLESALESGFNSAGVDVILAGPLPTPGVAYLTRTLRVDLGVVISASHNPFPDNGIKFFSAQGSKLSDHWELEVEAALGLPPVWVDSAHLGKTRRLDDAAGRYIEFCKSTFDSALTLKGLKIVVDAANGAAYHIAPKVFHELGAEVHAMGCQPDGLNINDGVGATHPEALAKAVVEQGADFGIALDGDADRLQWVDRQGRLYNGDQLLYVLAMDRLAQGHPVPGVVGTLMTNLAVELALQQQKIPMRRAKVGDRYVLEVLAEQGWTLGGEGSGHLLVLDQHTTGDGLVSALQVLQACVRRGQDVAAFLQGVELFPQTLLNVPWGVGQDWRTHAGLVAACEQIQAELGESGRILIRASGTEPVLRIMVEAKEAEQAKRSAEFLAAALV